MAHTAGTPSNISQHGDTAPVMNAVVHTKFGYVPSLVLRLATVRRPSPADDELS